MGQWRDSIPAQILEEFCQQTGRMVEVKVMRASFDFGKGSEDLIAFEEWAKNNDEWQREREEYGEYCGETLIKLASHNNVLLQAAYHWNDSAAEEMVCGAGLFSGGGSRG